MNSVIIILSILVSPIVCYSTSNIRFLKSTAFLKMSTVSSVTPVELTRDGGVKKTLISSGQGRKIETGDILAIEYTASLKDGNIFAKGEQEQCIVRDGSLIKGWDIGISSMKVGEKAIFLISPEYAYGKSGVKPVIPSNSDIEVELRIQAWLGNQLRPETLFQKDLDIDPFISSTPEAIQSDFESMQSRKEDKEQSIIEIYLKRLKNISFGFGGSGFFTSQSGAPAPWYLSPNFTFPTMISICLAAFLAVITSGAVREKGATPEMNSDISRVIIENNERKRMG
mmetsp:Transcript_11031/g.11040  ORF Transcript_11031/g.11040 Transcript_11031/m.11040 type:complete len:283 (+) Transcript_11031:55-903(+)